MQEKKLAIVEVHKLPHPMCAVMVPANAEPGDAVKFKMAVDVDCELGIVGRMDTFGIIHFVFPSDGGESIVAGGLSKGRTVPEADGFWKKAEA